MSDDSNASPDLNDARARSQLGNSGDAQNVTEIESMCMNCHNDVGALFHLV